MSLCLACALESTIHDLPLAVIGSLPRLERAVRSAVEAKKAAEKDVASFRTLLKITTMTQVLALVSRLPALSWFPWWLTCCACVCRCADCAVVPSAEANRKLHGAGVAMCCAHREQRCSLLPSDFAR